VKAGLRIVVLFILLNLLLLVLSFTFPGVLGIADNYQAAVQKMLIHQMEKTGSGPLFNRKNSNYTPDNVIQFSELTPWLEALKPGSIFFSNQGSAASEFFISGPWKHCGIYLGTLYQIQEFWGTDHDLVKFLEGFYDTEDDYLVFDSSYEQGVSIYSIGEMAGLADISKLRTILFFEMSLDKAQWGQVLKEGMKHLGKNYDYSFVLNDDKDLYCSEFLYRILPLEENYFVPSGRTVGRELLLPSDLVRAILARGVGSGAFIYKANLSKERGQLINYLSQ
jgi:Permuted papain-like amidase enzyme, YaeF/YiiX, C92 family